MSNRIEIFRYETSMSYIFLLRHTMVLCVGQSDWLNLTQLLSFDVNMATQSAMTHSEASVSCVRYGVSGFYFTFILSRAWYWCHSIIWNDLLLVVSRTPPETSLLIVNPSVFIPWAWLSNSTPFPGVPLAAFGQRLQRLKTHSVIIISRNCLHCYY